MTDAPLPTDQPEISLLAEGAGPAAPGAAAAVPQTDVESADGRTYRQRILDAFKDNEGDLTVLQLMQGTALSRNAVDSTLSVMVKRGLVLRVAQGLYRLAPPAPKADPLPTPATSAPRADGVSGGQWLEWLWAWHRTGRWDGPGKPPDKVEGIMTPGCPVPLDAWMTFLGQRDAMMKQQEADDALRARLVAAAFGNVRPKAKLGDLTAVRIMLASGVELDLIEMAVRHRHDRRIKPSNPPLASWPDLFPKVAELYARSVLAPKMVARWSATLANSGATTAQSPTLKRALSEIAPQKPADASNTMAANSVVLGPEVALAASPQHVAAAPRRHGL